MQKSKAEGETCEPVRSQREIVRDVMLSASECDTWLTLQELAQLTLYGEASISAQLRHLRKAKHGAFVIDKRPREVDAAMRSAGLGPVWEYRMRRGVRVRVVFVPEPEESNDFAIAVLH